MAQLEEGSFVFLSSDRMVAWLFLFPPTAQGTDLTFPQLCRALSEHDVSCGIDWALLRSLPARRDRYFQLFPIACGTLPAPGRDGRVIDRCPRTQGTEVQAEELGQADYVTLKLVREIQAGDVICELVPPAPGIPGNTVTGISLPAPEGRPAQAPQGRNTRLSEDGRFLVAAQDGHVEFSGRNFQVRPVLELFPSDLCAARTIKFLGDIHVHGDLCCGTAICALGSVQVDGAVEACSIEAGCHIIVSSGVQGQCDVTRSVSKMTEIERRGGKRWDKPKKAGKSRDCRGGKF